MSEEKYYKLPPETDDYRGEAKHAYIRALDFAFSNDDINNIAVMGPYGSGKSSIWKMYKEQDKGSLKNVITVSLADFKDSNGNVMNNDQTVENQIINQIAAQINPTDIPLSKYRYKSKPLSKEVCWLIFLLLFAFILLIFANKDLNTCMKILLAWAICVCIIGLIQNGVFHIRKLSVQTIEAEFAGKEDDETPINKEIKEIVYMLAQSGTNTVVFEDLDRLEVNNIKLFERLRNLNFVLNSYLKTNYKNKRIVRFVYMLREGIFTGNDRLKFFDFIVSVVPFTDSSNEKINIRRLLINEELDFERFDGVLKYVEDMRMVKNIANEYQTCTGVLSNVNFFLDKNKTFAMIVLKNMMPKEFENLQHNRGYVHYVLEKLHHERIQLEQDYQKSNAECNKILNILNYDLLIRLRIELNKLKVSVEAYDIYNHYQKFNPYEIMFNGTDEEKDNTQIVFVDKKENNTIEMEDCDFKNFLGVIQKNLWVSKSVLKEIEEDYLKVGQLHRKLKDIEERYLNFRNGRKFKGIDDHKELEDYMHEYDNLEGYLSKEHKEVIKNLICEGLIDYDYRHYLGYFYYGDLTKPDEGFLKNIFDPNDNSFDLTKKLDLPKKVMNYLSYEEFENSSALNINILKLLLDNVNKNAYGYAFNNSEGSGIWQYTVDKDMKYVERLTQTFINLFNLEHQKDAKSQSRKVFEKLNKRIKEDGKDDYLQVYAWTLGKINGPLAGAMLNQIERMGRSSDSEEKNELSDLYNYFLLNAVTASDRIDLKISISEPLESLNCLNYIPNNRIAKDNLVANLKRLKVKFNQLNSKKLNELHIDDITLLTKIIDNKMFIYNLENIKFIIDISVTQYYELFAHVLDYSIIKDQLGDRLDEIFNYYLHHQEEKMKLPLKYTNPQEFVIDLLNANIDIKLKENYIKNNNTPIKDLSKINDQNLVELLKKIRINKSKQN